MLRLHKNRPTCRVASAIAAVAVTAALPGALTACSSSSAEPYAPGSIAELKMADSYSLTHPVGKGGTKPFLDRLEEDPSVDIEYYASGQMGKQADIPSVVRSGVVDMAVISPSYVSSSFPLSSVGDLPGFSSDACVTAYALRDLVKPGGVLYEEELEPMKFMPLWTGSIPGYEAMTAGQDPSHPNNFQGAVLRSTGGALDRVINEIGAAGVSMPIGDMYEAMSRGTVEGTLASPISITPYGLEDVVHASTYGAQQGNFTFFYGINLDTWNRLNDQQKKTLTDAADKSQQSVCEELNAAREKSVQKMKDAGVHFYDVTDGETAKEWENISQPVLNKWIEVAESKGHPAQRVVDDFEDALKRHADRAGAGVTDPKARAEAKEQQS
ncbi:TRAP transporter substrate-binding protein DctP [Corynebacterium jeikeium]|uniref:TRAP transporter substrate-binding protein n=1 Tax=Corynebacterium jeikeium TaxID=38289 RepID=UPI0001B71775|nr:TRAP transporter substrate-binding protein DctP [Corynebacterium jeikeium]EEW16630.1 bacterial extracellular solute-binding protein, family 7 [Corynebacterium jeikeium ATCC 43734]OOD30692.1 ABC transporter substrate-binding protein [Corynebacterium jeikeium]WCZ52755.1 C4-dicarboxylate-binding periplasmic protein precursor [Corynebacterium jeikeium]SQI18589.1 extracellular solute-binding protein [Corynebacterium jeikeium]SUY81939.1 extracellular solute-binding protein [Corynebacterium jeikei